MIEFINTIGDVQLCLDPLVSASLITAGAGLINGIGNFFGAKSTNSLNARTAREINQKQIDFAREMNASEQAYNSIGEQMKRGMAAGVNPMLFAGAQPTSASSPGVPSLDTPVAQNPFAGVGVGATGTNIAQLVMQDKQQQLQQDVPQI